MPSAYYSPSATGTADGSSKANAYTSFATAVAGVVGKANDGTPYVLFADCLANEVVSSGVLTLTAGATAAVRLLIISVDLTGSTPPAPADFKPGATITHSASSSSLALFGFAELQGVTIIESATSTNVSLGGSANATDWIVGPGAKLALTGAGSTVFLLGSTGAYVYRHTVRGDPSKTSAAREPKYLFKNAGQTLRAFHGAINWRNFLALDTATSGFVIPTNLITFNNLEVYLDAEGVDFTGLNTNLLTCGSVCPIRAEFRDCLIPSAAAFIASSVFNFANGTSLLPIGSRLSAVRSSAVGAGFSNTVAAYEGGQLDDTTVTLVGGAGTEGTLRSWHLKGFANASLAQPYESQPSLIYNQQTSSITVALEAIWAGASPPTNAQVWMEVEALTTSGASLGVVATTGLANALATPSAYAASTASWNGTSTVGGSATKFRMTSPAFVPAQAGYLKVTIKAVAADVWVDPKPIVSGGPAVSRSFNAPSGALMNETASTVTNTVTQYALLQRFLPL